MKFKLVEKFTTEAWQIKDDVVIKGTLFKANIELNNQQFFSFDQPDGKVYWIKGLDNCCIIFKAITPTINPGFIHQEFEKEIQKYKPITEASFTAYVDARGEFAIELDSILHNKEFKSFARDIKLAIEDYYIQPDDDY